MKYSSALLELSKASSTDERRRIAYEQAGHDSLLKELLIKSVMEDQQTILHRYYRTAFMALRFGEIRARTMNFKESLAHSQ